MSRWKKNREASGESVPTSALPDIIFILLFFFMVSTEFKKEKNLVETEYAEATQITTLDKKLNRFYIYIGPPKDPKFGKQPKVSMNDVFIKPEDISTQIQKSYNELSQEDLQKGPVKIVLVIDDYADMGLVSDVEKQLKLIQQLAISYKLEKVNNINSYIED